MKPINIGKTLVSPVYMAKRGTVQLFFIEPPVGYEFIHIGDKTVIMMTL
jgi:hypothetical protein